MPHYTGTFPSGEVLTIYAQNIFDAEDEFYALTGDHPDTLVTEV